MKKCFLAIAACLMSFASANAFTSGISDVQPKGGFNLGVSIGVPPADDKEPNEDGHSYCYENANIPMISVDGNWVLASGMFNAGKFGQNGAIDLGFYYGFCSYENKDNDEWAGVQNVIDVRCAFHFEFVPKFDVYAGIFTGVNIESPNGDDSKDQWDTYTKFSAGPFIGCKYFFTDHFGLKAEFGEDVASCAFPNAAFGLAFKF